MVHQTQDRLMIDRGGSLLPQPEPNPAVPVRLSGGRIGLQDQSFALCVSIRLIDPLAPGIICSSRNPEEGTHRIHWVFLSVVFDDPISRLASVALRNSV